MNTANPAGSDHPAKSITIKDIELRTQSGRTLQKARKHYVQLFVGDTSKSTSVAKESKNRTTWDDTFSFGGDDRSILLVKVYQKRLVGQDTEVGAFSDTLGGALGGSKDGVFEVALRKNASATSDLVGITIEFTLTAELCGAVDADQRQALDAIDSAKEVVSPLSVTPATVGSIQSTVDIGTKVVVGAQTFETTWPVLLQRIQQFNRIVSNIAEIHPYASLAWSVLSAANKVLVSQKIRDEQIVRLAGTMSDVFDFVDDIEFLKKIDKYSKIMTVLINQVTECGHFITAYAKQKNFWIRTAKYTMSDIDAKIADFQSKFLELKTALSEGLAVQTGVTAFRMMNVVERIEESIETTKLNDMPYASGARFEREKGCLLGTRETLLREICAVLNDPDDDAPRVCLVTGAAGSGKSAVAHTIARRYDEQGRLGSSYCFARSDVANRNPKNLFTTIARGLSDHDPQYKSALWRVVKDNRELRTTQSPMEQIERFIIEPSQDLHTIGPLVVVVDALDECGDPADRRDLLHALSTKIAENALPTNLRFLFTSRPESDILLELSSQPHVVHKQMGDVPDCMVNEDLQKFIRHSLRRYATELDSMPNREWYQLLVDRSQTLFQWASAACNFILGLGEGARRTLDIEERFDIIAKADNEEGMHPLDKLYRTILEQQFTSEVDRRRFREVMAIILALREPLSIRSLSVLLDGRLRVRNVIKLLGSLLDGVMDEGKPIRPLHTSFRDFLLDKARSSIFHTPVESQDYLCLGRALLACMRSLLRFNICDLKDSRANTAVPGLQAKVNKVIPACLAYSCLHWMDHLQHVDCTLDLMNEVTLFFKDQLPFWLESISLLSLSSPQSSILSALETCSMLRQWTKDPETAELASEAFRFIQVFVTVLRESTPHLYLSAMPQTPTSSPLCKIWGEHLRKHASITLEHPVNWPAEIHVLFGHTSGICSVAFSPDGIHVVSGSEDKTIRIWDANTGLCVSGPFQGHSDSVESVAYSPDGTHVVSGSADKTIRIWDASTGQCVAGPFQGHSDLVKCVAYSPNGIHAVSGSKDKTIRVWDTTTGQCVAGPLQGHSDSVYSVAFSPHGTHLASGSADKTIRIWDTSTGQCVTGPFQGHLYIVYSVAYSPDGTYIASGSWDKTIRIWDATTGQCVAGPFQYMSFLWSIAYSPNGTQIVSSSAGIRICDASTGHDVGGPFQGHSESVNSVAYSPNGTCIVSGSRDKTIRIWDASTMADPLQGHLNQVYSVAYSLDGSQIASGSSDKTIRIWDAYTGQCVTSLFQGESSTIWSVIYSPDGTLIACGSWGFDDALWIWNADTGHCVVGPLRGYSEAGYSVAYSNNGTHIAPFHGHSHSVCSIAYSPNGAHIASCSTDSTIRIWDISTGHCVAGPFQGHSDPVMSIAYSPDGTHIVSGSKDNTIRIWDTTTGQCVAGPFQGHADSVVSVAYSPDGTHIVSCSRDKTIRIWDAITGKCVAGPFQGHSKAVHSVAYSPDGANIIFSGSYYDGSIRIWKVQDLVSFCQFYEQDGWIQSSNSIYFAWLAPWNREKFHPPIPSLIMHPDTTCKINTDIDHLFFKESWTSCWQ